VTHHGDEHVDEDNNDGDVIQSKQKHSYSLHNGRRVVAARETVGVHVVLVFTRVFDLDTVDVHESEHRPEQAVERSRQSEHGHNDTMCTKLSSRSIDLRATIDPTSIRGRYRLANSAFAVMRYCVANLYLSGRAKITKIVHKAKDQVNYHKIQSLLEFVICI